MNSESIGKNINPANGFFQVTIKKTTLVILLPGIPSKKQKKSPHKKRPKPP